ncbi:MAG TPA: GNAT family N-acetyltransferase [Clostridiaceae bacterium]|nr:GNAT family N-acetyltransferase [Clostridiaceae bacterium]
MLTVISIEDSQKWDNIVRSFKDYDVYYLSGYVKAFQIHGDGEPVLFYYETEDMRAINAVMKRDISHNVNFASKLKKGEYFDLITPYGYGGYIIEGNISDSNITLLNTAYTEYCKENNIISEFVRFHPILKNKDNLNRMYDISGVGKTISIDLASPDIIWNNFTGKNRNMVRKAQKSGVKVYWGRSPELLERFIIMYKATMLKNEADKYYYFEEPFFNSILYDLKHHSLIFYAMYNNEIIAMSIILFANQKMHYHLSASNRLYQKLAPTNLLLYEAACWGFANNFKVFHLGGGLHSREDNLYRFKKAFNKNLENVYTVGKKCFNQKIYNWLVSIRSEEKDFDDNTSFFPLYRA